MINLSWRNLGKNEIIGILVFLLVVIFISWTITGFRVLELSKENEGLSRMLAAKTVTRKTIEQVVNNTIRNQWYQRCGVANSAKAPAWKEGQRWKMPEPDEEAMDWK